MQAMIDNGYAWKNCGPIAQEAMAKLETGECMLPKVAHRDYYGNLIPARQMQSKDEFGSFNRSAKYWTEYVTKTQHQ